MKKLFLYPGLMLCLIMPASCLTSLQPLVTLDNIVVDNRITGNWQHNNDIVQIQSMANASMFGSSFQPTKNPDKTDSVLLSKTYSIVFKQKGIPHTMSCALTRISNNLFFELMPVFINDPERPDGSGFEYTFDYLPTYTIGKISFGNNAITLQFLNGDFIREQISSGNMRIKHEKDDLSGTFLITASSTEMQQFLQKYGNDGRLFTTKNSITLTRKG